MIDHQRKEGFCSLFHGYSKIIINFFYFLFFENKNIKKSKSVFISCVLVFNPVVLLSKVPLSLNYPKKKKSSLLLISFLFLIIFHLND